MRPNKHQREIIIHWLKVGAIDSRQLDELRKNPYDDYSDDELREEGKRFAKIFSFNFCSRMKDLGKCRLYNQCKARK